MTCSFVRTPGPAPVQKTQAPVMAADMRNDAESQRYVDKAGLALRSAARLHLAGPRPLHCSAARSLLLALRSLELGQQLRRNEHQFAPLRTLSLLEFPIRIEAVG